MESDEIGWNRMGLDGIGWDWMESDGKRLIACIEDRVKRGTNRPIVENDHLTAGMKFISHCDIDYSSTRSCSFSNFSNVSDVLWFVSF